MARPLIQVKDLTYYYPGGKKPVLRGINLDIEKGEFVLIIGSSGGGKSTLGLSLNGIIPTVIGGKVKGKVYIDGEDTRESTVHGLSTKVGIVLQDPDSMLCNLHVEEELAFGPANLLMDRDIVLQRVKKALDDVGETKIRDKSIYSISGGQKQRIAIASVLTMEPVILVFDEPTANLDPVGTAQIFSLLKKINQEKGITVIVVEHNVDSIMNLVDRLVLMKDGVVKYSGVPREIMRDHGRFIIDNLGLRIPQICELGLLMEEKGVPLANFPLTVDELAEEIKGKEGKLDFKSNGSVDGSIKKEKELVIDVESLNYSYPDGTHAVRDVSLQLNRGDVVALLGQNGSGKTSLTSLFVGINKPSSGKGLISGIDINNSTIRELSDKVGYVFQYPEHQFVETTVREEVAYGLKARKLPQDEIDAHVDRILKMIGLDDMPDKHPFRISMGQKRRLSVASMMIMDTDILILDEPTRGQDRQNIETMMDLVMKANSRGTTIILVLHDMNIVARYCNRVVVMDKGKIVFNDDKKVFFDNMDSIKSDVLVLPEVYELAKTLRETGKYQIPEVFTIEDFITALEVN
ncbi:MAG: energy-coupling factor ABC transporter ATP-binding protein [Spirochaetales bacterium]|nr:energy-coupling factor ABC transporter ATP-binding protein [Spirochaetales bacterium]